MHYYLGVVQYCHHEYTEYAGWEGVNWHHTLFKNVDYAFSYRAVKNQQFQSSLLGGREGGREGVTKKSTLCSLLIMLIILDDPAYYVVYIMLFLLNIYSDSYSTMSLVSGVFLHVLADTLGSVGVIISTLLIL